MVMVYCEGPTEWCVIRKLNQYSILEGNLIEPDERDAHIVNSPSKLTIKFLTKRPSSIKKFLLVYDREHYNTPQEFVNHEFNHLGPWQQKAQAHNIFCTQHNSRTVYLHINDAVSPNGYGDFDGYLWNLINNLGPQIAQMLSKQLPAYIRKVPTMPQIWKNIHQIGTSDMQNLMKQNDFPIQRSKGHIYAYITALQMAKSHVWFSEKLVEQALSNGYREEVKNAFSSLIQAWNWLNQGESP